MTDSEINEIVAQLPEHHRDIGRRKIMQAIAYGWTEIYLATFENVGPHHLDLMGRQPVTGKASVLPENDEARG